MVGRPLLRDALGYRDDIGIWVSALYPILAALSYFAIFVFADLLVNDDLRDPWLLLPCVCLAAFLSVVLAMGGLAALASIPLLIQRELQRPKGDKAIARSRLVALLIVAPGLWIGLLWLLMQTWL